MKFHLYNSKIKKLFWFIKRFGLKEIILKPFRNIFAPLIIKSKGIKYFKVEGKKYQLFYHKYNITWANERCVEIPLVYEYLKEFDGKILEIGNVLQHYYIPSWQILDRYEKGRNILNKDVHNFKPKIKYDLIVSISTFEHIGYDDSSEIDSAKKIIESFENLKENCLEKGGKIIFTVPLGYNPSVDEIIKKNLLGLQKEIFIKRISEDSWVSVSKKVALRSKYGKPFPYANAVFIGYYEK